MAVFDQREGKPALPHGGTFSANPLTMARRHCRDGAFG